MTSEKTSSPHSGLQIAHLVEVCEIALWAIKEYAGEVGIATDLSGDYLDELEEQLEQFMEE